MDRTWSGHRVRACLIKRVKLVKQKRNKVDTALDALAHGKHHLLRMAAC